MIWIVFCPFCWRPWDVCLREQLRLREHFMLLDGDEDQC